MDKKNKIRLNVLQGALALAVVAVCLWGMSLSYGILKLGVSTADQYFDEAKNLTFPGNETKQSLGLGMMNFYLLNSGAGAVFFYVMLILNISLSIAGFSRAWRLHKNIPTLEERVKRLEDKIVTKTALAVIERILEEKVHENKSKK